MKSQSLPPVHHQVYTCAKCHALCLPEDLNKAGKCKACSRNKYNAKHVIVGTIEFDSQREATRYQQLLWRQKAHEIGPILLQPPYPIVVGGDYICSYYADFCYTVLATNETVVEDVKSPATRTAVYRLKKKLVESIYSGVKITEV